MLRPPDEVVGCGSWLNFCQQAQCNLHMLAFENHVGLHRPQNFRHQRPACDHQITHAGPPVTQISSADDAPKMLEAPSGGRALREGDTRSDIEPELVFLLPHQLEVDAAIPVQEAGQVSRLRRLHCWPSLGIAQPPYSSVLTNSGGFHRYKPMDIYDLLPGAVTHYDLHLAT